MIGELTISKGNGKKDEDVSKIHTLIAFFFIRRKSK
jgi:hypothetical protein